MAMSEDEVLMVVEVIDEEGYRVLRKELDIGHPTYEDDVKIIAKFKDGREEHFYAFIEDIHWYICGDYLCLIDSNGNVMEDKKVARVIKWW